MTRNYMLLVPRSSESFLPVGVSVNSLGVGAGMILVKNQNELDVALQVGIDTILKAVTFPVLKDFIDPCENDWIVLLFFLMGVMMFLYCSENELQVLFTSNPLVSQTVWGSLQCVLNIEPAGEDNTSMRSLNATYRVVKGKRGLTYVSPPAQQSSQSTSKNSKETSQGDIVQEGIFIGKDRFDQWLQYSVETSRSKRSTVGFFFVKKQAYLKKLALQQSFSMNCKLIPWMLLQWLTFDTSYLPFYCFLVHAQPEFPFVLLYNSESVLCVVKVIVGTWVKSSMWESL